MKITLTPGNVMTLKKSIDKQDITFSEAVRIVKKIWGDKGFLKFHGGLVRVGEIVQSVFVAHGEGLTFSEALQNAADWRAYHNGKYKYL